jgi:MATE family multidrug resistance protein
MFPTTRSAVPGDYRALAQLAAPILLVQLSILATAVVDTLMAGRRSPVDLAAVGLGSSLYIVVFVAALGVLLILPPQFARLNGSGEKERLREQAMQALWTAVLLGVFAAILLWHLSPLTHWMSKSGEVSVLAEGYLRGFAVALPAILTFRVFYALSTALGKASLVAWINVALLVIKIPLNVYFMDWWEFGAIGCGISMAVVSWISVLCAVTALFLDKEYHGIAPRLAKPQLQAMLEIFRSGYPVSLMQVAEVASFAGMGMFISGLGAVSIAAHQAAANLATTLFMIPLSLSLASSVLVSKAIGANDLERERARAKTGLRAVLSAAIIVGCLIFVFSDGLAAAYSSDLSVQTQLKGLLLWLAISQAADCSQVYFICVLRSYDLTVVPFIINVLSRGIIGLGGGLLLSLGPAALGVTGFWIGSSIGLATSAILLWRYWRRSVRYSNSHFYRGAQNAT